MSNLPILSLSTIEALYQGRLDSLLLGLCSEAGPAVSLMGRHVVDPNGETKKGKKTFRLDKNFSYNGKWFYDSNETNHGVFNCISYLTGWSMATIHTEANNLVRNETVSVSQPNKQEIAKRKAEMDEKQRIEWAENAQKIKRVAKGSMPLNSLSSFPVLSYLGKRGIDIGLTDIPKGIGFHPQLDYWEGNSEGGFTNHGKHPCMLCKVTNLNNEVVTLHRTYLDVNGNKLNLGADVDFDTTGKKLMSPARNSYGASIKFHEPIDGVLAIAEGVETALSVFAATSHPVWATVSASMMVNLEVPSSVRLLLIYADKDKSRTGEKSAEKLKARMEERGIKVLIFYPPTEIPEGEKSVDWNDELVNNGARAFVDTMREYVLAHESLRRIA